MKIIAVDDEPAAVELLADEIKTAVPGAQVISFQFPDDVMKYAKENSFDVAFLDIEMPQMNGISLAKRLKSLDPALNIIFVTAYRNFGVEAFEMHASGYLLKPVTAKAIKREMDDLRFKVKFDTDGIYVSTFGQFDISAYGKTVHFGRAKSKEMLAYLIDRRGGGVTRKELAAVLFEDREYTRSTQDYLNKIVHELEVSLREAGIGDIFIKRRNYYAVDTSKITCDMYEYESGNPAALNKFNGEYMTQYSWGETTLGRFIK